MKADEIREWDETEIQARLKELQEELQIRLSPIIQQVATERGLHMLFSVVDSGLVWADPSLDITPEVIQKFDAAPNAAAAPKPAAAPAPTPAAAPAPKPAAAPK